MTLWLVNPGAKRKRRDARARITKRRKTRNARASAPKRRRNMARKRNARGQFTKRKASRRRRRATVSAAPRRRARRRRSVSAAPRRRARRRYRRNPPMLAGAMRTLVDGAQGAVAAVVGKAAARAIPAQAGLPTTGSMGLAVQAGAALVVGMVANKVARKHAPFVVAGALMAPIEQAIRGMGIPVLSPALAGYYMPAPRRMVSSGGGAAGLANGAVASYYSA